MRKLKASFSLIIMILIVGMFSAVAFAAEGPIELTVKQNADNTLTLNWSPIPAASNNAHTGITYDLTINELDGAPVATETGIAATTYTTVALDAGKKYTLTLTEHATDSKGVAVTGTTDIDYSIADYNSSSTTGDAEDNNFSNANHTGANASDNSGSLAGYNGVNKAKTGHKVHGSYQNNTNSCASCHQTHTGNDSMLLFKNGTYSTCSSCHDGTLGIYNVFEASNAGTFSGTHAGNMSVHLSNGAVAVKAAPGGFQNATETDNNGTSWSGEFTCASCHAPHGSDSIRLLSTNPAGVASKNAQIYSSVPAVTGTSDKYIWVKETIGAGNLANYPAAGLVEGSKVVQLYKLVSGVYTPYYSLIAADKETVSMGIWFSDKQGHVARTGTTIGYYTSSTNVFGYLPTGGDSTKVYDVLGSGTGVDLAPSTDVNKGVFTIPVIVTGRLIDATAANGVAYTKVDNRAYFDSAYTGKYVKDSGVKMSQFCTACHSDYLSDTHNNESGVYTTAYRHQTSTDKLTCVRCHFAHGSDATIMKDSQDRGIPELTAVGGLYDGNIAAATTYLTDTNPSSALKRYTGMGVCFGCHDTSIGNDATTIANSTSAQPGTNITQ